MGLTVRRETALRQRELAVQARERAVEQKTEELTVLRAEVSGLYLQLRAQLPNLHSRCALLNAFHI